MARVRTTGLPALEGKARCVMEQVYDGDKMKGIVNPVLPLEKTQHSCCGYLLYVDYFPTPLLRLFEVLPIFVESRL
jgi:hypothetical protein